MADIYFDVDAALAEVAVNALPIVDAATGATIKTDLAYNAAGMALFWHFVTPAGAHTVTAVTPTTAGVHDWAAQSTSGIYTLEFPASGGTINNDTEGFGWFTGFATGYLPWRSPVYGFRASGLNDLLIESAYSATRGLAGTALPAAAAEAAGGLYTRGTGAGQINQAANGQVDANVATVASAAADTIHDEVVEGSLTFRQAIRLFLAVLTGKASGLGTTTATYRDIGDTKDRIVATVDADGNRTAIGTRDGT